MHGPAAAKEEEEKKATPDKTRRRTNARTLTGNVNCSKHSLTKQISVPKDAHEQSSLGDLARAWITRQELLPLCAAPLLSLRRKIAEVTV